MSAGTHEYVVEDADHRRRAHLWRGVGNPALLLPFSTFAGCVAVVLCLWPVTSGAALARWFNMGLLLVVALWAAGSAARRAHEQLLARGTVCRRHWFLAASLAAGAFWGMTSIVLLPAGSPLHQATLALIIAAVTALWLPLLVIERVTVLTNAAPALLPMAFNLLTPPTATPLVTLGSLLLVLFAVFVIVVHLIRRMLDADDAAHRALYHQATHDRLVGLVNHAEFSRRAALLESGGSGPYAVVFIDLDRFKLVNDTAGHREGDRLLREVGAILRAEKRKADVAARVGGDEFAILMRLCSDREALRVARAVSGRINALSSSRAAGGPSVTASIGIACSRGATAGSASVVEAADRACYAAKRAGRNRIELSRQADTDADGSAVPPEVSCPGRPREPHREARVEV